MMYLARQGLSSLGQLAVDQASIPGVLCGGVCEMMTPWFAPIVPCCS